MAIDDTRLLIVGKQNTAVIQNGGGWAGGGGKPFLPSNGATSPRGIEQKENNRVSIVIVSLLKFPQANGRP